MNALVDKLIDARRENVQFAFDPSFGPSDADEAYSIQAAATQRLDSVAIGWKVGVAAHSEPFAAPILASDFHVNGATLRLPPGEPVKLEVELAIKLGNDLPSRSRPYSRADVLKATCAVCVGFELVRSRYLAASEPTFLARIADNYNNFAFVAGGETSAFTAIDLAALRVRFWLDDDLAQEAAASHQMGDPIAPVVAWANAQCDRLGGLRAGQWVTTGTLVTPEPIMRPARLKAAIDMIGEVSISFVAR